MGVSESSCIGVVLVCAYVCEYIGTCVHTIYLKEVKQIPSPLLQSLLVLIYMYHHIYQGSSQKKKKKKRIAFKIWGYFNLGGCRSPLRSTRDYFGVYVLIILTSNYLGE